MAAFCISLCPPVFRILPRHHRPLLLSVHPRSQFHLIRSCHALNAYRNTSNSPQESDVLFNETRKWAARLDFDGDEEDEDDEEEEEEDRSLDLFVRFVENVFRKVSRRARKAVRSVLPVSISTKLVGFAVNGVIILSFLWVLKAFLEVSMMPLTVQTCSVLSYSLNFSLYTSLSKNTKALLYQVICTLGSVVFVSILLIRGVWSGLAYLQESRNYHMNGIDDDHSAWSRAQPVT